MFSESGYEQVSMADIAREMDIHKAGLYSHFGSKKDIVLYLYQRINTDWQVAVEAIPAGKLEQRFVEALELKLALMEPYLRFLSQIMGLLIQDSGIGVTSLRTSHIRRIGAETIGEIIHHSTDSRNLQRKVPQLSSMMYFLHWTVLFARLQSNDNAHVRELLRIVSKLLGNPKKLFLAHKLFPVWSELSQVIEKIMEINVNPASSRDREILKVIFNHRKTSDPEDSCASSPCETCFALHEQRINFFTSQNKPIHFILPAFPAKSPNRQKTLSKLPDLGEEIALKTLDSMCREIGNIYKPGAQVTICSDGRIFSGLVGVSDEDISKYVAGISGMLNEYGLENIRIVNLEDLSDSDDFNEMRKRVLTDYAEDLKSLNLNIKTNAGMKSLFNGIHRFITEDCLALEETKSKSQVKKEAKTTAIKVIQHSNAWTRFLANVYPDAIRLSIHPYPAHHRKTGIQLTRAEDNWLTPWHGVIMLRENGYHLIKRGEAEALEAKLVYKGTQPYYYSLIKDQ